MLILSGVSNMCLFAPAPYYKLTKGFFFFLFKPLGGLHPSHGLNKKALEKYPLLLVSSAGYLPKQFGPRSGPTKFDTLIALLK